MIILTEYLTWVATWSMVEITVGIIVACLPASRIIILRYLPNKPSIDFLRFTNKHRLTSDRSSKRKSTTTLGSGKRESQVQPPARLWDTPCLDPRHACSTTVSISSPAGSNTFHQTTAFSSIALGIGGRDSDLPLVAGVHEPQPVAPSPWMLSVANEQHHKTYASRPNVKRIWSGQHIDPCIEPRPVMGASRSISDGEREEAELPGSESV